MSGEREPNPVAQVIALRTVQVGLPASCALAGAHALLPPAAFAPLLPLCGALVTGGLSAYFVCTFDARIGIWGIPCLVRLADKNAVAFTFDDGPHPDTTPRLLDILAHHHARATFFVVGDRVRQHPHLAARIVREGHTLGVHGLHHRTMVTQSARQIASDLRDMEKICQDATGAPLAHRLLRPPYGFKTWTLGRVAVRLNWTLAYWSLDVRDYDPVPPAALVQNMERGLSASGGDILLLHERTGNATLDALPPMLSQCAVRGLRCVALTDGVAHLGVE